MTVALAQSRDASRELPPIQIGGGETAARKKPVASRRSAKPLPAGHRIPVYPAATQAPDVRSVASGAKGQPGMASEITIAGEELNARPFTRPGEALEAVPGLIVTQHSGEGKANQYFLRGYNLDHGTDLAITVDGVPVNMRTHAHGQGSTSNTKGEPDHLCLWVAAQDRHALQPLHRWRRADRGLPEWCDGLRAASRGAADVPAYDRRGVLDLPAGALTA